MKTSASSSHGQYCKKAVHSLGRLYKRCNFGLVALFVSKIPNRLSWAGLAIVNRSSKKRVQGRRDCVWFGIRDWVRKTNSNWSDGLNLWLESWLSYRWKKLSGRLGSVLQFAYFDTGTLRQKTSLPCPAQCIPLPAPGGQHFDRTGSRSASKVLIESSIYFFIIGPILIRFIGAQSVSSYCPLDAAGSAIVRGFHWPTNNLAEDAKSRSKHGVRLCVITCLLACLGAVQESLASWRTPVVSPAMQRAEKHWLNYKRNLKPKLHRLRSQSDIDEELFDVLSRLQRAWIRKPWSGIQCFLRKPCCFCLKRYVLVKQFASTPSDSIRAKF